MDSVYCKVINANSRLPRCDAGAGHNGSFGFPLWGKLSPQVTDEGATSGHFPLIRRVPRHLPPKGKAFPSVRIDTLRRCAYNKTIFAIIKKG